MFIDELVSWFTRKYSNIVKSLIKCNTHYNWNTNGGDIHINKYHAEGSAWAHIMMVMALLKHSNVYQDDRIFWQEIAIVALLHDIGKIRINRIDHDKKHVYFIGHAGWSTLMALTILEDLAENFPEVEFNKTHVLQLINWHDYAWQGGADKIKTTLEKINNYKLELQLLYLMNFDEKGNFHIGSYSGADEQRKPISEYLKVWVNKGEELSLFADCVEVEKRMKLAEATKHPRFIMLVGLPCSGKSMIVKDLIENDNKVEVFNFDEEILKAFPNKTYDEIWDSEEDDIKKIEKELRDKLKNAIDRGCNIILDMTNLTTKSRRKKLNMIPNKINYFKTCICVMSSELSLNMRNLQRSKVSKKTISNGVMRSMIERVVLPFPKEFDHITYIYN